MHPAVVGKRRAHCDRCYYTSIKVLLYMRGVIMGKVMLDLPLELKQAIEQVAQRSGRSQDVIMQEALESYVEQQGVALSRRPLLRSAGIISDSSLQARDIDDWLEANWLNHLIEEQGGQLPPPVIHKDDVEAQQRARQRGRPFFRSLGAADNADFQAEDSEDWLKTNWRPE